jgi:polyisoprenoid-binding protein YceI
VRFMGLSTVRGAFAQHGGTIMYLPGAPERSSVSAIIGVSSINTNGPVRDRHLKSPDFFDAEKFPYITFRSSSVRRTGNTLAVEGDLTMHGVTKRVTIPFTMVHEPTTDAWQNTRVTFQGNLRVSRKEYGIAGTAFWNSEFDPGRFAVADDVDIELLVSGVIPNVMRWAHPVGDSIFKRIEAQGVQSVLAEYRAARQASPAIDSLPEFGLLLPAAKLIATGKVADGIAYYETMAETRPRSTHIRAFLGEAYLKAGRIADARREFAFVARSDSLNTGVREWLRVLPAGER